MKKNWSLIFTAISCVGVVATAALSFRAGLKYEKFLEGDIKEKALIAVPPIVTGAVAIGASIAAHKVNAKAIAGLTAAVALGTDRLNALKDAVKEKCEDKEAGDILARASEIENERHMEDLEEAPRLYRIDWTGKPIYFEALPTTVLNALSQMNRELVDFHTGSGIASVEQFLDLVNHKELSAKKYGNIGWSTDILELDWDMTWLDFYITKRKKKHRGKDVWQIDAVIDPLPDIEAAYKEVEASGRL